MIQARAIGWLAIAALLLLAPGCAHRPYDTGANFDTSYDFSKVDLFAFTTQREKTARNPNAKILEAAIRDEFTSRRFTEVEADRAEILISYDIGVYARAKLSGQSSFATSSGGLTVSLLDPATRRTVWYGWSDMILHPDDEDVETVIRAAVEALFESRIPDAPGA